MTPTSFVLPVLQAAAPQPHRPADSGTNAGDGSAFARALSRARDADNAPSSPEAATQTGKPAPTPPAHAGQRGTKGGGPGRTEAASPAKEGTATATDTPAGGAEEPGARDSRVNAAADGVGSVNADLPGLPGPPPAPPGVAMTAALAAADAVAASAAGAVALTRSGSDADAHAAADQGTIGAVDARGTGAQRPGNEGLPLAGSGQTPTGADLSADTDTGPGMARDGEAAGPASTADLPPARPDSAPTLLPLHAAAPSAHLQNAGAGAATGTSTTPFEAQLSAALGGHDFAPALGQQISVLVQGGVQHARLHLNPAEMGPITVQIAVEGLTAQVHLAAEQPLTRQALDQAMPVLAGALRDSGLLLTGGGVFEQPREAPRDGSGTPAQPAGRRGDGAGNDADPAPHTLPVTRSLRGAVDLIA